MKRILRVLGAVIVVVLTGCQSVQSSGRIVHTDFREPLPTSASFFDPDGQALASTAGAAIAGSLVNDILAIRSSKAMIRVFFEFDTVRTELGVLAEYVPAGVNVLITGHTDAVGTAQYNLQLGMLRAQFVADHLSAAGVDRTRMTVASSGQSEPIASNNTVVGRAKNRRVEIRMSQ